MLHLRHRWTPWHTAPDITGTVVWRLRDCTICGRNQAHRAERPGRPLPPPPPPTPGWETTS
jgi:hypothetical protein